MRLSRAIFVLAIVAAAACHAVPALAQDPVPQLRERAAPSIVKIKGKGISAAGREVPFEGSGFVIAAYQGISVIVTAAHVLGKPTSWRPRDDGSPDRETKVWVRQSSGTLGPLPLEPDIVKQDDVNDYAILLVKGEYPALKAGDPLKLTQGAQALVLGYPLGDYDIALDDGRARLVARNTLGLVLQLSDMQTSGGQSGGPILDFDGRVLGILSGGLRERAGTDLAVPITTIQPALAPYVPQTNPEDAATASTGRAIGVEGRVRLELAGSGGGDFGRSLGAEARMLSDVSTAASSTKVGDDVSLTAKGGERSDCKEDSGRTISMAQASASVLRAAGDALVVSVDLYAHGGHYRTAASCVLGQPVGLTGHDTTARATGIVQGSLRIPVLDNQTRVLRLSFDGLPQADALIEMLDPDGAALGENLKDRPAGEKDFEVGKKGVYIAKLSIYPKAEAGGGFGDQRTRFNARLRVQPIGR